MTTKLFGHTILETIYESSETLVYKALNETTNKVVVLKVTKKEGVNTRQKASSQLEKEIIDKLKSNIQETKTYETKGIPESFGIEEVEDRTILILQDGGRPLSQYLADKGALSISDFLRASINITKILGDIHQHHVIHKDIKPANILIDEKENNFYIIDFNISTLLDQEKENFNNSKILEGSLPYMSPEQTGRMNRNIDYRTDFYSLGITFFQLITGKLPYESDTALDLVHFHIAKKMPKITAINSSIPLQIEKIIEKLTNKNAEDRYQTTYGLLKDLEKCQELWTSSQQIDLFPLGTQDISGHFSIPQKLYGRFSDIELLLNTFEQISKGKKSFLTISGVSGIGKTSLVHEVHRPIVSQFGIFMSGKFEQFKRDIPYSALKYSFNELVKQLMVMGDKKIAFIKEKLKENLGSYGRILTDFSPSLKFLFGELPALEELPPAESLGRFNLNVIKFFHTITQNKHPIVIFIDDLQWADSASLDLFRNLLQSESLSHFLFIGAYRDNEVGIDHPLVHLIEKIKSLDLIHYDIKVSPFKIGEIQEMLFDMFQWVEKDSFPLAEIILAKTGGNPFFVTEFLKSLYRQNLIFFDNSGGKWHNNFAKIKELKISENVVDLMLDRLKALEIIQQELIMLGSCLGTEFSLNHITIISNYKMSDVAIALWPILKEGLLIPIGTDYHLLQGLVSGNFAKKISEEELLSLNIRYRFVHDRVQQAANELATQETKISINLKVARLLLSTLNEQQIQEKFFDIVNHYNQGFSLVTSPVEIKRIAELNYEVAYKGIQNMAFGPALKHIKFAINIFQEQIWKDNYEMALKVNLLHIECEYLNQNFEISKNLAEKLLQRVKNPIDRVDIYQHLLVMHATQSLNREAVIYALEAFKILGISEKENLGRVRFVLVYFITIFRMRKTNLESLQDAPVIIDKKIIKTLQILSAVKPSCYLHNLELLIVLIFRCFTLSAPFGVSKDSAVMLAALGSVEIFFRFSFTNGKKLFDTAHKLLNRFPEDKVKGRVGLIHQYTASRFSMSPEEALIFGEKSVTSSLNAGDSTYAATNSASNAISYGFFGISNSKTEKMSFDAQELCKKLLVKDMYWLSAVFYQVSLAFAGKTKSFFTLDSDQFNEKDIDLSLGKNQRSIRIICLATQILHRGIIGREEDCRFILENLRRFLDWPLALAGSIENFSTFVFMSISFVKLKNKVGFLRRQMWLFFIQLALLYTKMHRKNNFANFNGFYQFIKAAKFLLKGQDDLASLCFEKAKDHSITQGQPLYTAFAYESLAQMYFKNRDWEKGYKALDESIRYYDLFGAPEKIKHLALSYSGIAERLYLAREKEKEQLKPTTTIDDKSGQTIVANSPETTTGSLLNTTTLDTTLSTNDTLSNTSTTSDNFLDFETIFKSSQILSREIHPKNILSQMMTILLKNSGATKIIFLQMDKDSHDFHIKARTEAEGDGQNSTGDQDKPEGADQSKTHIFEDRPYNPETDLASSVIKYIKEGSKIFITADASIESDLLHDPYISKFKPKSLLCTPIMHQGKMLGILYLENELVTDLFTKDRIQLLELLTSQMSVSIENATLYENLEEKVKERTLELRQAQQKLVTMAHKSGMADIASGILHNIGNILPSFYFFVKELKKIEEKNILLTFDKILGWFKSIQEKSFDYLFNQDPKGKKIVEMFDKLEDECVNLENSINKIISSIDKEILKIENIVDRHQEYAQKNEFKSDFSIIHLLDEIEQNYPPIKQNKSIQFKTVIDPNLKVTLDRHKILIITSELIKNAYEELIPLDLELKQITFSCIKKENDLEIIIEDNGRGIPDEIKNKILQGGESNLSTKSDSSGLGITDSIQMVKSIGGHIEIHNLSQLNSKQGTRFTIIIPLSIVQEEEFIINQQKQAA